MDGNLPGCSVHGVLQARILEWVAITSSRGSSQPRDRTLVFYASCIGRQILYHLSIWEALPKAVDIYKNVKISQRQPRQTMAMKRSIPIRKDYLRSLLESKDYQIKQTKWDTYFTWHAKPLKRFKISKQLYWKIHYKWLVKNWRHDRCLNQRTVRPTRFLLLPSIFIYLSIHSTNPFLNCLYTPKRLLLDSVASVVSDSETLGTVAHQAPLSMEFSRQEFWSELPCSPPRNLPDRGIEHLLQTDVSCITDRFFTTESPGNPIKRLLHDYKQKSAKLVTLQILP